MGQLAKVDITILSWDRIDDTLKAIDSAVAQQGIEQRVIVVDQGSEDSGLSRLRRHCEAISCVTLVCNGSNSGVPGGRNIAARQGDGDYLVALDNDAEFIDSFQVAKAVEVMRSDASLGAIAFRILRFGSNQDDLSSWSYHQSVSDWAGQPFFTDRFVGAGHMILRQAFEQIGCYDDALFFLHEEVDLSKRLINIGYQIRYSPEVVIGHKVSAEHRVAWSAGRWRFDIRNKTYLHIKFRTFFPTFVFHTSLMMWRGIRSGLWWATISGVCQGFAMAPAAIRFWSRPSSKASAAAADYYQQCSPTKGMSLWRRVVLRLKSAKPVPMNVQGS
ncbi:glycosyl transferase [Neiella marina]|uniref:Glycosyl transferase n=1 Tax=Neiella marina TaxID=508461 RepID=A0A8J2XMJ4_9GAMM|nr:glycosyltransferase [Neiella marina]GGA64565.1 glycosyl transferase [Neiella marina]